MKNTNRKSASEEILPRFRNNMIQRFRFLLILILLNSTAGFSQGNPTLAKGQTLDRIVAVIDDEIILESELNAQLDFLLFNERVDSITPEIKRSVLEGLITDKLILAQAIVESVYISDDEVQQQLEGIVQQRAQQIGGEKKLEEFYGMSLAKMKIEFREEMRKQLLVQRLQQTKFSRSTISRRDVEEFFQNYRDSLPVIAAEAELAHIFIKPKPSADVKSKAREKAERIRDSLLQGGDFQTFAKQYSDDAASGIEGGDLGFVRRGQFVKEFEEAAFALKDREFAPVIETQFGFHIIQLLERRGDAVRPRHILIKVGKSESDDSLAISFLSSLNDSILAGKTFAELAKRYSEDTESALVGGAMGIFPLAQLETELKEKIDSLNAGQITEPLKTIVGTNSGYHLVLLKKKTSEHQANLQDDWKRIEQLALQFKRTNEYKNWIEELKKNIYWESRL